MIDAKHARNEFSAHLFEEYEERGAVDIKVIR